MCHDLSEFLRKWLLRITHLLFFSHQNNQTKGTKVNQPCDKPLHKMFLILFTSTSKEY